MRASNVKIKVCTEMLAAVFLFLAFISLFTIGPGYSASSSSVTNTDNVVSATGTELKLTNTAGNLLSYGSFDDTVGAGGHLIDYHKIVNGSTTTYVIDSVDRHIGNAKIATSSTNGITDVTLLCSAEFKVSSSGATFTGLTYHFSLADSAGTETTIPSAGIDTTIANLNGKTLSLIIDGLTQEPPGNDYLVFSITASYAGEQNIAINSGNHLLFANYPVDVPPVNGTEIATIQPTTVTSGGVSYPAYAVDYTGPEQNTSIQTTINGTFCLKFVVQKKVDIQIGSNYYTIQAGTTYCSFVNGTQYTSATLGGLTMWMTAQMPITVSIHHFDAAAGVFMTVIYPPN